MYKRNIWGFVFNTLMWQYICFYYKLKSEGEKRVRKKIQESFSSTLDYKFDLFLL